MKLINFDNFPVIFHRNLFAKALIVKNKHVNKKMLQQLFPVILNETKQVYQIADNLQVQVVLLKAHSGYVYIDFCIYLGDVLMATYCAKSFTDSDNWLFKKFDFPTYFGNKMIYHMPYKFVRMMNQWAANALDEYITELEHEKAAEQQLLYQRRKKDLEKIKKY